MENSRMFTLLMTESVSKSEGPCAIWEGRSESKEIVSLDQMVDEELLPLRKAHMNWAYETGVKIGKQLEPNEPLSMWWTSLVYERHPRLSPHLYIIYKLACVEKWLIQGQAKSLYVGGGSRRLRKSLKILCKNLGLGYLESAGALETPSSKSGLAQIYARIPAPLRAAVRLGHWLVTVWRKFSKVSQLAPYPEGTRRRTATIATYFPNIDMQAAVNGRFTSRYWENLHICLNEEAQKERPGGPHFVRWLFVRFPAPGLTLEDCLKLRNGFQKNGRDGLSFNFVEEMITVREIGRALARWGQLSFRSLLLQRKFASLCHLNESCQNFWAWLAWEWAESFRGWRCLERCLFNEAFLRYCKLAGIQRWTLFALENCPWERMLTEACRTIAGNGPVFGAQHSSLRPTDFRYFDDPRTFSNPECAAFQPDVIAGNGASSCTQWRQNDMPDTFLCQVEALRYLYLATKSSAEAKPNRARARRMLVVTSFFREETKAHLHLLRQTLERGLLSGWEVVLKPHPYLMPTQWLDTLSSDLRKLIALSTKPLALELAPGTALWASNSTTAALEGVIAGLPVMVMAPHNDFDLCPIQDLAGLARTGTVSDVADALKNLQPLKIAPDYLDLNSCLIRWRRLLGLTAKVPGCNNNENGVHL